jgi:drug/metabolite transporter (DMT)-like permease
MRRRLANSRTIRRLTDAIKAIRLSAQAEGVIAINLAAIIFGAAALFGKLNVSPIWIVAVRAGFAALTLGCLGGYRTGGRIVPISSWAILALSGCILGVHWLAFFMSVQLAGVAVATLTFATFPLFTVILEASMQRRLPRPSELAVGIVIVVAVALLVDSGSSQGNLVGSAMGLMSAITYALFWRVSQSTGAALSRVTVAFYQNVAAFALFAPALFIATPAPSRSFEWLSLMALGVINTAVMLQLYLFALKRISASTCSGFVALEPVYAIIFAALLFHEPITSWIVISIILILGASLTLLKIEQTPLPPA